MSRRILALAASAATVLASTLVLSSSANAEPDPNTPYGYAASAGGTLIRVAGSTVSSDPTSPSGVLGTTYPASNSNTTASVHVGTLLNVGAVTTTAGATKVGTDIEATATAET